MTPKLPFRVGEYEDEIVDADGNVVLQIFGGEWSELFRNVYLRPDEVALRDFVIQACNKFGAQPKGSVATAETVTNARNHSQREAESAVAPIQFRGDTITSLEQMVKTVEGQ